MKYFRYFFLAQIKKSICFTHKLNFEYWVGQTSIRDIREIQCLSILPTTFSHTDKISLVLKIKKSYKLVSCIYWDLRILIFLKTIA